LGIGRDLSARHKDGTEFPVEIRLSTVEINGNFSLGAQSATLVSANVLLPSSEPR
jgi:hypothetical protein